MTNLALTAIARPLRRPRTLGERIDLPRRATLAAAGLVVVLVGLLLLFIGVNGVQLFTTTGVPVGDVLGPTWSPSSDPQVFGILPFILGTVGVMVVAAIIAAPLSIGLAVFMSE